MVKRLTLLLCVVHTVFAGPFLEDLKRVYPRGLNMPVHQPSRFEVVKNFILDQVAEGASFATAQVGQELVDKLLSRWLPQWPTVNWLVRDIGHQLAFSGIYGLIRSQFNLSSSIQQASIPYGVERFDELSAEEQQARSPLIAHVGLSPQSAFLKICYAAAPIVAMQAERYGLWPLSLVVSLVATPLHSVHVPVLNLLVNSFGMPSGNIKNIASMSAVYALGKRTLRNFALYNAASLVGHYVMRPIDAFLTPPADAYVCTQMACADCITDVAHCVPAETDSEASAWKAHGHACREGLQAVAPAYAQQNMCPIHASACIVQTISSAAQQAGYVFDQEMLKEIIDEYAYLLCELTMAERSALVTQVMKNVEDRIQTTAAAAQIRLCKEDIKEAIELVRFTQHNTSIINEYTGLTARLPQQAFQEFELLPDEQIRQVCAILMHIHGAITADRVHVIVQDMIAQM